MAFDALYLEHAAPLQTARRLTLRTTAEQVTQGLLQVRLAEPVPRLGELARAHILAGAGQFASALRAQQYPEPN
jgi:hypothetical protein